MIKLTEFIDNPQEVPQIHYGNETRPQYSEPSLSKKDINAIVDTNKFICKECGKIISSGEECDKCKTLSSKSELNMNKMIKLKDILKSIIKEAEIGEPKQNDAFEEDPMNYILKKYKRLSGYLKTLMGDQFKEYLGGVFIVSGKPTTFKILLKNGQYFYMVYMGKTYEANILGKRYYLMNLGEIQMATMAISRILRYGNINKAKGPESEEGPRSESLPSEEEQQPEEEAQT